MRKNFNKFLVLAATMLIVVAQAIVTTNACAVMANETEIPESLNY